MVSFNRTDFVCRNQDFDGDVKAGEYYRVQFLARNNDSSGTMPTSATYYIEGCTFVQFNTLLICKHLLLTTYCQC